MILTVAVKACIARYLLHAIEDLRAHDDVLPEHKRAFNQVLAMGQPQIDLLAERVAQLCQRAWTVTTSSVYREHPIYQALIRHKLAVGIEARLLMSDEEVTP